MKLVRRNAKNKLAKIFSTATEVKSYNLFNSFAGAQAEKASIIEQEYTQFSFTKIYENENGCFTLRLHSNQWYTFKATA